MSTTDAGVGYFPKVWGGWIFLFVLGISLYMLYRSR
jgi:hypothetical protein